MFWWTPDSLYAKFSGTDAEMTKITLPVPTQKCIDNRVKPTERCSANQTVRVGKAVGACDDKAKPLEKLISGVLYDLSYSPDIDPAIRSPGYDVLRFFKLTELQLGEIFDNWRIMPSPREAICEWIVNNMDYMNTFVTPSYPRTVETRKASKEALLYVSVIFGILAVIIVIVTLLGVYKSRKKPAIVYAQIEFLFLLLSGAFLISLGAIVQGFPPSDGSCVLATWLINLGYTLELIPLIVKVGAINRMMSAARQMRRIVIQRSSLFGAVAFVCLAMIVYLIVWTAVDRPMKSDQFDLSHQKTEDGATVVELSYFCASKSEGWQYAAVGWNALLLLCATVIAYQTRNIQKRFNESRPLATMIYSHFVFVVLRMLTVALRGSVAPTILQRVQSLIFSVDTVAGLAIYFLPKLHSEVEEGSSLYSSSVARIERAARVQGIHNNVTTCTSNTEGDMANASQISLCQRLTNDPSVLSLSESERQPAAPTGKSALVQFTLPDDFKECATSELILKDSAQAQNRQKKCEHCGHVLGEKSDQQEQSLPREMDSIDAPEPAGSSPSPEHEDYSAETKPDIGDMENGEEQA